MDENCGEGLWLNGCVGGHLRVEPSARLNAHNCFYFLIRLLVIGSQPGSGSFAPCSVQVVDFLIPRRVIWLDTSSDKNDRMKE
jgi:hypothetical protein